MVSVMPLEAAGSTLPLALLFTRVLLPSSVCVPANASTAKAPSVAVPLSVRPLTTVARALERSEERRVGKESTSRWSPEQINTNWAPPDAVNELERDVHEHR